MNVLKKTLTNYYNPKIWINIKIDLYIIYKQNLYILQTLTNSFKTFTKFLKYSHNIIMSVTDIKDQINILAGEQAKSILSFLGRKDLKSFSQKRKISNAIQSVFIDYMESKCPLIISKKQRKQKRKVYFADDVSLPSSEKSSLVEKVITHIVSEEEYKELQKYRYCYNNTDFLDGMRRRCEEQRNNQ